MKSMSGIFFASLFVIMSFFVVACSSDKPPVAPAVHQRNSSAVMTTYGVCKMISDSGVIRYKIVAEEWQVFDRTNPTKQKFPKGILLEKFNQKYQLEMYLSADTAYWYNENLWELRGRVRLFNKEGTSFKSELLYWNMENHEFYSDKYSHLITPDREVEGTGFHSNEQMTKYEINYSAGSFPIPEHEDEVPEDSIE